MPFKSVTKQNTKYFSQGYREFAASNAVVSDP